MGYHTDFFGSVTVEPPLNEHEVSYLKEFSGTRRMSRKRGPYFAHDDGNFGQGKWDEKDDDILNYNSPDTEQPGLWCQWVPTLSGDGIEWDGGEKFYYSAEWMKYIIDHFLVDNAILRQRLDSNVAGKNWFENNDYTKDPRFDHFTFDHVVNGQIEARGEDPGDHWMLVVENNVVKTAGAVVGWANAVEL